jgi:hypothetical protein
VVFDLSHNSVEPKSLPGVNRRLGNSVAGGDPVIRLRNVEYSAGWLLSPEVAGILHYIIRAEPETRMDVPMSGAISALKRERVPMSSPCTTSM